MNFQPRLNLLFVFGILILMGCLSNNEKDRRILEINESLEKQIQELNFYELDDAHYFKENIESAGKFKTQLEQMLKQKVRIHDSYNKLCGYLSELKYEFSTKSNIDIDQLNDDIFKKVNSFLDDLHSVVNEDNYRGYEENKNLFAKTDGIYRTKRNYLIKGDPVLNKVYLTKVNGDLLLLKRMYNKLIDSYIILEDFYKPPAEVFIFDNSKNIKSGEIYQAEILWASNFFNGIGENLERVVIDEIEFGDKKEKLDIKCQMDDSIVNFKYLPRKPGKYKYFGHIEINQHGNYLWKIPFSRQFQINE